MVKCTRNIIIFLFILLSATIVYSYAPKKKNEGSTYYLDAKNGDDSNDGLSAKTAWKSLDKIQPIKLKAGDHILLRRGCVFNGILEIHGMGRADNRIVVDAYGKGKKPCVTAPDNSLYAIRIKNSDYVTLQNLEVINTGTERLAYRTGVKVFCEDYGVSHNIVINALDIHDVNGSLIKHDGGGSGILIENKWKATVSIFDSLVIEHCTIRRCERNAMIWSAPWNRQHWHPSTNTIVRKNLIEEVPGDGIVPIGCDGALVEYNLMRKCTDSLNIKEAAAGIWPWSCDNTTIQFNEVSDHKAPWDGQGFDSDYNCTNTTIQYNYSHDNQGGFILICNAGKVVSPKSVGNIGTVVQYNISINDAIRTRKTHTGKFFSPTIHIGGPCKDTRINNNILHVLAKPGVDVDRSVVTSNSWDGYADNTTFANNVFYSPQSSGITLTESTHNAFSGNYYLGTFSGKPMDEKGRTKSVYYESILEKDPTGFKALAPLMEKVTIADGAAFVTVINKKAIEFFFANMSKQ